MDNKELKEAKEKLEDVIKDLALASALSEEFVKEFSSIADELLAKAKKSAKKSKKNYILGDKEVLRKLVYMHPVIRRLNKDAASDIAMCGLLNEIHLPECKCFNDLKDYYDCIGVNIYINEEDGGVDDYIHTGYLWESAKYEAERNQPVTPCLYKLLQDELSGINRSELTKEQLLSLIPLKFHFEYDNAEMLFMSIINIILNQFGGQMEVRQPKMCGMGFTMEGFSPYSKQETFVLSW